MDESKKPYTIKVEDGFIRVTVNGVLTPEVLGNSNAEGRAAAKEAGVNRMLSDIQGLDKTSLSIPVQAKSIGLLWDMRDYDKVAFLVTDKDVLDLLTSSLQTVRITDKFQPFDDEAKAIAWLKS